MEIHSRVVSVWVGSPAGDVITPEGFLAEAWLRALDDDGDVGEGQDAGAAGGRAGWVEVCGLTSEVGATYTGAWDMSACVLHRETPAPHPGTLHAGTAPHAGQGHLGAAQGPAHGRSNLTRCTCSKPGTIALLLVAQTAKVSGNEIHLFMQNSSKCFARFCLHARCAARGCASRTSQRPCRND